MRASFRVRVALASLLTVAPSGLAPGVAATPAESPAVLIEWNTNATTAIVATARQPPHAAILSFAIVQAAVYDAVNAIDGGHQPYLASPSADPSSSKPAAVAAAAYRALLGLFPGQAAALDGQYAASMAAIPDGAAKNAGEDVGEAAAAAILAARAGDGRGGSVTVTPGSNPGEWRPAPPAFATEPAAWVGNVRTFVVPTATTFRSDGPNALDSAAYAADFNEVKAVGSATSSTRTADQTDAAIFWQDNGAALWNRIFRTLIQTEGVDLVAASRLLAITNVAAADGAITCWNDKYLRRFWRPITAIRAADTDDNPATEADATWSPLFGTPAFPEHPSGHGCVSGAIVNSLQSFFGTDKVSFSAFSNNSNTTRHFARLSHAIKEIVDCRVWAGIHFRTADVQGSVIGKKVAFFVAKHAFQPLD